MSIGDQANIVVRLAGLIPNSWFPDDAPVKTSILNGAAGPLSWAYSLYSYSLLQSRIATATGVWLDRIAFDFFGTAFPRMSWRSNTGGIAYENDDSYRARIKKEILRPRATRAGVIGALQDLTGNTPILIEGWNPSDTSAYSQNAYYGQQGIYGTLLCRNQIFVTAYRPLGQGIPNVAGYGHGFYSAGTTAYIDLSEVTAQVPDSLIYLTGARTVAAGITCWMDIVNGPAPTPQQRSLDLSQEMNSQNLIPWFTG